MSRELDEVNQEYAQGKLEKIKEDLELFIKSHKEPIKAVSARLKVNLDIALRFYILHKRTINTKKENLDQICEMKKEIWYRHEEDSSKPENEIIADWTRKHAAGWRDHRIIQILFVYLQDKDKYLALLT